MKKNLGTASFRVDLDQLVKAKEKCPNLAHVIRWVIEATADGRINLKVPKPEVEIDVEIKTEEK